MNPGDIVRQVISEKDLPTHWAYWTYKGSFMVIKFRDGNTGEWLEYDRMCLPADSVGIEDIVPLI